MSSFSAGDIVMRSGTFGAGINPVLTPVLILAVNKAETMEHQSLYTVIPVSRQKSAPIGCFPITSAGHLGLWGNFGQLCMTGESAFRKNADGHPNSRLDPRELAMVREHVKILTHKSHAFGDVIYSATPAHNGLRGKNNRPYVCLGEIGRNSGKFLCLPIASQPSGSGCGFQIKDIDTPGLRRDFSEKSFTRDSWVCVVDSRQASRPAGKLGANDLKSLSDSFDTVRQGLLTGEIIPPNQRDFDRPPTHGFSPTAPQVQLPANPLLPK